MPQWPIVPILALLREKKKIQQEKISLIEDWTWDLSHYSLMLYSLELNWRLLNLKLSDLYGYALLILTKSSEYKIQVVQITLRSNIM